ncbi:MAG: fibrobacter succinogenes major paralogous domain-containing protein [Bacteroidia bacterium]
MKLKAQLFFCSLILSALSLSVFYGCEDEEETPVPKLETDSITDIDGNVYTIVKIGEQWWMAENLEVKTYRNGNPIPLAKEDTAWKNASDAYCRYDNNSTAPGLLYNWYAVNDSREIAPTGWHIPTDEEWKTLEKHLGMSQTEADGLAWRGTNEGDKLKIQAPEGWTRFENIWGTNESGFTALAGSCRLFNGTPGQPGLFQTGFWWSKSEYNGDDAWYRYLDYKNSDVFRSHTLKAYGFSLRCVKD